jgi:hypothetical protein
LTKVDKLDAQQRLLSRRVGWTGNKKTNSWGDKFAGEVLFSPAFSLHRCPSLRTPRAEVFGIWRRNAVKLHFPTYQSARLDRRPSWIEE